MILHGTEVKAIRKGRVSLCVCVWAVAAFALTSCTAPAPSTPTLPAQVSTPIAALAIDGVPASLPIGESRQLTASAKLPDGARKLASDVAWKSSDEAVATVSSTGLLTAKGPGAVDVSAAAHEHSTSTHLQVLFRVVGTVRESEPTTDVPVPGARVEVQGGADAGKTAVTDNLGHFQLDVLSAGFTITATREGYDAGSTAIGELPRDQHPEIALMPDARRVQTTLSGTLCADAVFHRRDFFLGACAGFPLEERHQLVIHRGGPIDIVMRWEYHFDYSLERMWLDVRCGSGAVTQEYGLYESYHGVARTLPGDAQSIRVQATGPAVCEFRPFAYGSFKSYPPLTNYQIAVEHPR